MKIINHKILEGFEDKPLLKRLEHVYRYQEELYDAKLLDIILIHFEEELTKLEIEEFRGSNAKEKKKNRFEELLAGLKNISKGIEFARQSALWKAKRNEESAKKAQQTRQKINEWENRLHDLVSQLLIKLESGQKITSRRHWEVFQELKASQPENTHTNKLKEWKDFLNNIPEYTEIKNKKITEKRIKIQEAVNRKKWIKRLALPVILAVGLGGYFGGKKIHHDYQIRTMPEKNRLTEDKNKAAHQFIKENFKQFNEILNAPEKINENKNLNLVYDFYHHFANRMYARSIYLSGYISENGKLRPDESSEIKSSRMMTMDSDELNSYTKVVEAINKHKETAKILFKKADIKPHQFEIMLSLAYFLLINNLEYIFQSTDHKIPDQKLKTYLEALPYYLEQLKKTEDTSELYKVFLNDYEKSAHTYYLHADKLHVKELTRKRVDELSRMFYQAPESDSDSYRRVFKAYLFRLVLDVSDLNNTVENISLYQGKNSSSKTQDAVNMIKGIQKVIAATEKHNAVYFELIKKEVELIEQNKEKILKLKEKYDQDATALPSSFSIKNPEAKALDFSFMMALIYQGLYRWSENRHLNSDQFKTKMHQYWNEVLSSNSLTKEQKETLKENVNYDRIK